MRFVHCSDVHVTADYRRLPLRALGWRRWLALLELGLLGRATAYAGAAAALAAIARDAQALGAHLVLSGDVTGYALASEFAEARSALGPLGDDPRRCTVVPGNHDTFTRGSVRTRRFEEHFGHLLESDLPAYRREGPFPFVRLVGEEAAVVGLCSARLPPAPGMAFGSVGAAQLSGLEALLDEPRLAGRALLVVVHHAPLGAAGRPDSALHGLRDGARLLRLLKGPRFAVLHGHLHARYHHPATAERPHLFGAGSSTQAGREGYWLIEVADGCVQRAEVRRPAAALQACSAPPV